MTLFFRFLASSNSISFQFCSKSKKNEKNIFRVFFYLVRFSYRVLPKTSDTKVLMFHYFDCSCDVVKGLAS